MPVAFLPLGTLEWHGPHMPLGADGIQSKELFIELAGKMGGRSEERRVGKECRSRWSPYH